MNKNIKTQFILELLTIDLASLLHYNYMKTICQNKLYTIGLEFVNSRFTLTVKLNSLYGTVKNNSDN